MATFEERAEEVRNQFTYGVCVSYFDLNDLDDGLGDAYLILENIAKNKGKRYYFIGTLVECRAWIKAQGGVVPPKSERTVVA